MMAVHVVPGDHRRRGAPAAAGVRRPRLRPVRGARRRLARPGVRTGAAAARGRAPVRRQGPGRPGRRRRPGRPHAGVGLDHDRGDPGQLRGAVRRGHRLPRPRCPGAVAARRRVAGALAGGEPAVAPAPAARPRRGAELAGPARPVRVRHRAVRHRLLPGADVDGLPAARPGRRAQRLAAARPGHPGWRSSAPAGLAVAVAAKLLSSVLLGLPGVLDRLVVPPGAPLDPSLDLALQTSMYGAAPTTSWWWLATSGPHSGTPLDLLHTAGCALAVLCATTLLARSTTVRRVLLPARGRGFDDPDALLPARGGRGGAALGVAAPRRRRP